MENNHDIDKKFNEASQSLEEPATFPGFDKVWAKVEEKLDKKEDKKKIIPIWFPYGIAASLIIGLGAFYFINKNDVSEINKPAIAQNEVSPKVSSDVQAIDSMVKSNIEKQIDGLKENQNQKILAYEDAKTFHNNQEFEKVFISKGNSIINRNESNGIIPIEINHKVPQVPVDSGYKESKIEEVVVLGYNKTQTSPKSYSSTTVNAQKVENRANQGYLNSLQGSVPGLAINSNSSTPGSSRINYNIKNEFKQSNNISQTLIGKVSGLQTVPNPEIQLKIRGISSLNANSQPLYVINGVIQNDAEFRKLNPNTIESVSVLKDAAATSIYGNRGSNGVIVIKTKRLSRKERKAFEKLQKVQDSINASKQIQQRNNEEYDAFVENPFELTKNQSVSTFSIDVDKAAYSNIRRMINNGEYVNKNAVRIEEMINYFKYDYPQPKNNEPFSINTEYNDSPWNNKHKLLKIGLQGKEIPTNKLPNSNFVFLIDVSGSMNEPNKLPLLKSSFKVLLEQLRPTDKVGIVVYAGSAGMVLPPTSAKEKGKIIEALDKLQAGGSTAGGEGIELAYKLAQENFIKNGNNRVIIATDGDFNVGASSTGDLQTLVEEKRKSGVFLTCLGFGMGNFKDNRMETLANKGNGNYAYIDNLQEANKFLGKEFAGNMYAIAKDVKIQIEFNPKYVKSYRLIGYENRKLKNEDFTNDKIDAGELGSGHTVTALYEVIPNDVNSEFLPKENDLKYTKNTNDENFNDELATVKFRYKKPDGDTSSEIVQVVKNTESSFSSSSDDFKFASSVAWFGLVLRNSALIKNKDLNEIEKLAKKGRGKDEDGYRAEFVRLIETYQSTKK
ncbi:von Willebrand factor type A domain-containing protein [Chryseobacterium sp. Ch-15]|uniref:von Willebrand factor type A domain-containing protein n=1 Tax=Chryseobacterium muglaense TaxID=2893752 RepID=A0A9Q3YVC3_9FLAO|nr:VWA domain-containing protein [Chryseobacterium muglaense]MBD3906864.1 von Willebrand factor type A domain-containing protein [Chryseobacterium muglaense]MCC9036712.1 von Willebrand factor type A domain-containing protein [Chryseobacterium muglaense]MCM2555335.1 von Willebrand factor type A domain-containing protein [Chryseobacterium muglaense]